MCFGKTVPLNFVMKRINLMCVYLFLPSPIFYFSIWFLLKYFLNFSEKLWVFTNRKVKAWVPNFKLSFTQWGPARADEHSSLSPVRGTHSIATGIFFCMFWALLKGPSYLSFLLCHYIYMDLHNSPLLQPVLLCLIPAMFLLLTQDS